MLRGGSASSRADGASTCETWRESTRVASQVEERDRDEERDDDPARERQPEGDDHERPRLVARRGARTSRSCPRAPAPGRVVARRMRRDASAVPRRITQDAASAISIPTTPITVPHSVLWRTPVARPSAARSGTPRPATRNTGTPSSLELERVDHALGVPARAAEHRCARCSPAATAPRGGRRGCGSAWRRSGRARRRGSARRAGRPSGPATAAGRRCRRAVSRGSRGGRATRAPRPCSGAPAGSRRGRASGRVRAISCSISRSRGLVTSIVSR